MDYSTRKIKDVSVVGIQTAVDKTGRSGAGADVHFTLQNRDDPSLPGPSAAVSLFIDCDSDTPISEVESQLVEAAQSLLSRFVNEPLDKLLALYRQNRDERTRPDPIADLFKPKDMDDSASPDTSPT